MARPVTVTIENTHGIEGAKSRVEERFEALQESIAGNMGLKFERHWEGDSLKFVAKGMGQRVTGDIDVFPEHVRITVVLPALLAGMAEALKGRVEKGGQILLEDKTPSSSR